MFAERLARLIRRMPELRNLPKPWPRWREDLDDLVSLAKVRISDLSEDPRIQAVRHRIAEFVRDRRAMFRKSPADAGDASFTIAVVVVSAKLARADGGVNRAEIEAFKRTFPFPQGEAALAGRMFDEARVDAGGFEPYAERIARLFEDSPHLLEDVFSALYHIAVSDGPINSQEGRYLRRVGRIFGLSNAAMAKLAAGISPSEDPDPYAVLGVSPDANDAAIRTAYRQLLRENHPDAVSARGVPADFIATATRRTASINAAYARIREERGRMPGKQ